MKIYFQNEHTAENGKSEYSLGWNNFFLKKHWKWTLLWFETCSLLRVQLPDLLTGDLSVLKTIKDVYILLKDITLYVGIYIVVFFKDFLPQGHRHYQEPSDNQQWISPSCLP